MKKLTKTITLTAGLLVAAYSVMAVKSALTPANVDSLVEPYLQIQSSLSRDNLSGAKSAAKDFIAAAKAESSPDLTSAAGTIAGANDIKTAREAFLDLSNGLIAIVREVGTTGHDHLYLTHCPMAFGGKGSDWLQNDKTVANPYYGASMLRCGGIREDLASGGHATHQMQHSEMEHKHGEHGMMEMDGQHHGSMDLDKIHAGVTGYSKQAGTQSNSSDCQMACCQSDS